VHPIAIVTIHPCKFSWNSLWRCIWQGYIVSCKATRKLQVSHIQCRKELINPCSHGTPLFLHSFLIVMVSKTSHTLGHKPYHGFCYHPTVPSLWILQSELWVQVQMVMNTWIKILIFYMLLCEQMCKASFCHQRHNLMWFDVDALKSSPKRHW
jgi:hypothetical protein